MGRFEIAGLRMVLFSLMDRLVGLLSTYLLFYFLNNDFAKIYII